MEIDSIQLELESQRQKVDVEHVDMTVRELIRMSADNELIRAPEYQRKFRWNDTNESRLIESILLGLPVPAIYVAANKDGSWELVDGLQRVSTLIHFAPLSEKKAELISSIGRGAPLKLSNLEKLHSFNGMGYDDLPMPMQLSFMKRMLRVTALSDKSDTEVRYDLFERLNTGGVALSAQEVRACVYKGEFKNVIEELAAYVGFSSLLKLQAKRQSDGTREEQVLKFFAYLRAREKFTGKVKEFLNRFSGEMSSLQDFSSHKELFVRTVDLLGSVISGPLLRAGVHTTPLNQFEAVMVAAAELIESGVTEFKPRDGWLSDGRLVRASTGATNTRRMLETRIQRAGELLTGAVVEPLPSIASVASAEGDEVMP